MRDQSGSDEGPQSSRTDAGFTLVELLIAIVLSSVIAGVIVAAIATSLNIASSTTRQVSDSADAGLISAFLYRDAKAAGATDPATAQTDASAGVSTAGSTAGWAGCAQTGTFVVRFSWIDRRPGADSRTIVSTYALDADRQLTRRLCQDGTSSLAVLSHPLTSAVAVCSPTPACGATTASVSLTISGSAGPNPFSYSLVGVLRAELQTRPTSASASAVPLITLGGSAGAASCPNLSLSGSGRVNVLGDVVVGSACDPSPIKGDTTRLGAAGPVRTLASVVDPFLGLPPPVSSCPTTGVNPTVIGASAGPETVTVYPKAVAITGAVSFAPGHYVFCAGLSIGVGATVSGSDVFFFMPAGSFAVNAAAVVDLRAATTGTYANLLVWVATAQQVVVDSGPRTGKYVGYVYAPTSTFSASGGGLNSFGGVIAGGVTFGGTNQVRVGLPVPPIEIGPSTLNGGQVGVVYPALGLVASDASDTARTAVYTWSATGLPTGLTIDPATGVLTGTPRASGSFNIIATVFDGTAASASRPYTLVVNLALGIATPNAPATGQVGVAFPTTTLSPTGGTAPFSWSSVGLPAGMVLNSATGVVTGTPTAAGAATVAFTVTDALGATATRSFPFSVTPALTLATRTLAAGQVGVAYAPAAFAASGGTNPLAWSATGLPPGMVIDATTGTISGSPTAPGTFNVVVKVNDSNTASATTSASLTIAPVLALATSPLPNGQVGIAFASTALSFSGGTAPYTWSATGLPPGITIEPTSGVLSGTPTTAGTYAAVVTVVDASQASSSANYSIAITPAVTVAGPATLPVGQVGVAYPGATMSAAGGTAPFRWSATGLAAGLVIDPATGVVSGSPTASGTFTVQATVTDTRGSVATRSYTLTVNAPLAMTPLTMPAGRVGIAYATTTFSATGGSAPYTWSATGLPAGLVINASTGAVTGTPTTAGSFTAVVTVRDANTANATQAAPLTIASAVPAGCPVNPAGWRGEYFRDIALAAPALLCRDDAAINFDWGSGAPATGLPTDMFSVRWTRTQTFAAGTYTFSLGSDDGSRLFIDGVLVLDRWSDQGYPSPVPTVVRSLTAGAHTIVMEYYERGGSARATLSWTVVTTAICPAATGWQGQYYNNMTLTLPVAGCRDDAASNFNWGSGSPFAAIPVDGFSVRWTKTQNFSAGTYRFALGTDDGGRLYIDGVLVIESWSDQSYPDPPLSATRTLTAGSHTIVMEYDERSGDARATLTWSGP